MRASERVLVLSFTGCWFALKRKEIDWGELDTALFYMGCARAHIFNGEPNVHNPNAGPMSEMASDFHIREELTWEQKEQGLKEAMARLREVFLKAEKEGRLQWRSRGRDTEQKQWEDFSYLLRLAGVQFDYPRFLATLDVAEPYFSSNRAFEAMRHTFRKVVT